MQTKAQQRQAIAEQLGADPQQSNRVIAAALDVNDKLVATVRGELETTGDIPVVEHIRTAT